MMSLVCAKDVFLYFLWWILIIFWTFISVQTLGAAGKWRFKFDQESGDEGGDVWRISSAKYNRFVYASDNQ